MAWLGGITFTRPMLPVCLAWLRIRDLRIGTSTLDLLVDRSASDVGIHLERREGEVEVVVIK